MTDILAYWSTHPVPQFPTALKGVFCAGSVNPLHKSPQCQQALRKARVTAIKILKTNLDGPSPRVAISFGPASRPAASNWKVASWYGTVVLEYLRQSRCSHKVTRLRLRVVRRRTHMDCQDGQGNVACSGGIVSRWKGPFPHIWLLAEKSCFLRKNVVLLRKNLFLLQGSCTGTTIALWLWGRRTSTTALQA